MNQQVEQEFRKRFENYLEKKQQQQQQQKERRAEEIVQLIVSTLEEEFRTNELEDSLTGFKIFKNFFSNFDMQVLPLSCKNRKMDIMMEKMSKIPYDQEVFESVEKFISSLENLSKCSLINETKLEVLF